MSQLNRNGSLSTPSIPSGVMTPHFSAARKRRPSRKSLKGFLPPPLRLALPIALLLFGILAASLDYWQSVTANEAREKRQALERSARHSQRIATLASILLPAGREDALEKDLALSARIPGAGPAVVCDENGTVLCSGDPQWDRRNISETPLASATSLIEESRKTGKPVASYVGKGVIQGACAFAGGFAVLEFDFYSTMQEANDDASREAIYLGSGFAIVGAILWAFLHFSFAARIGRLVDDTRAFEANASATPRALEGADEIAELSRSIASMCTTLRDRELALEGAQRSLKEKNKELESIFYVASHDLRSPLVNVQGFSLDLSKSAQQLTTLLQDESGPEREKRIHTLLEKRIPEAVRFVTAGVTKMDSLLKGLLRLSRLGRASIRVEELDMNRLLGGVVNAMEFQLQAAGAKVQIADLPAARGDATQINQVFSNLLDNALKYRSPSRPLVVRVEGEITGKREATFRVIDNGQGIAPEHQARVFEIFHRLNPSEAEGEGLGLTIAQRIIERLNGTIAVSGDEGVGATFTITLPRA